MNLDGLYEVVRCGLAHEYHIKLRSNVDMVDFATYPCGIIFDNASGTVTFKVEQYYRDFRDAFQKYLSEFKSSSTLLDLFGKALASISSPLIWTPSHADVVSGYQPGVFGPSSGPFR